MENPVMLKSEVLVSGKGCPVCGGKKTEKAKTCRKCLVAIGPTVTRAVNRVAETVYDAMVASTLANAGEVARGTVWGPFLGNVRIDMNAQFMLAKGDIAAYWHCKRAVPGGYVSVFIFGAEDCMLGQTISGLAELKVKFVPTKSSKGKEKQTVHYVRVQAVKSVKGDVKLAILEPQEIDRLMNDYLPATLVRDENYGAAIGFLPVKAKSLSEENPAACAG